MPDISFFCTYCGGRLSVDSRGAGLSVPCPLCTQMITAPKSDPTKIIAPVATPANRPVAKKYEFTGQSETRMDVVVRRIVRLHDGLIGGWIEKESNLSHECGCWVYDDATVFGNAVVAEEAQITWGAMVYGDAKVFGRARVTGTAFVFGNAQICDNALVAEKCFISGNAVISGDAVVRGYLTSVSGDTVITGTEKISGNSALNPFKQKSAGDAIKMAGLKAMGILTFSSVRWLDQKYGERRR